MIFQPKVSIVIPVYNGSNYLSKAIDSALAQTYSNIEILVINDGSDDNGATREIAISYGDSISYFEKENGGVSTALNMGIEKMTGEYFSWLSHDDEYYPEKIELQIQKLETIKNKKALVFSDFVWIDENNKILGEYIIASWKPIFGLKAIMYSYVNGCALLIPKVCFEEIGKFDESLPVTQDFDLLFRLIRVYPLFHLSSSLVKIRLHTSQTSNTFSRRSEEGDNLYIKFVKMITLPEILKIEKNEILFYIKLMIIMDDKNYCLAKKFIKEEKLNDKSELLVKILFFYFKHIDKCWRNRISLPCIFKHTTWSIKRLISITKLKVLRYG